MTDPEPRFRVIPFATLTAASCRVVADRGRIAITRLGHNKVGRVLRNRWTAALDRLDQIADRGSYGTSPVDLHLDIQAIVLATDFFQIADIMPTKIPDHIDADLAKALEGRLERSRKSRVAEEFLSQFWFGMVIARSGISPGIPKAQTGCTPDYVVSVETLPCAVEVKRPASLHSAPHAMDRAARQISDYGQAGFIAMDLTDALCSPSMSVDYMDEPGRLLEVIRPQFVEHTSRLERRVQTYTRSDKYQKVLGLAQFARLHFWEKPDLSQPKGKCLLAVHSFDGACSGQVFRHARTLKRIVFEGAAEVSGGAVLRI